MTTVYIALNDKTETIYASKSYVNCQLQLTGRSRRLHQGYSDWLEELNKAATEKEAEGWTIHMLNLPAGQEKKTAIPDFANLVEQRLKNIEEILADRLSTDLEETKSINDRFAATADALNMLKECKNAHSVALTILSNRTKRLEDMPCFCCSCRPWRL